MNPMIIIHVEERKASFRIHEYDTIYTGLKICKAIPYRILLRDTYTVKSREAHGAIKHQIPEKWLFGSGKMLV